MVTLDNNSDTSLLGLNNNYENKEASKKLELTNKAANGDDTKVHKNPRKELFKDYASDRKSSLTEVNETNLQKRLESEERLKACEKDKTSEVTTKEANNSKDESKSSEIDDLIKKYCPKLSEKSQSSDEKALVTNLGASSDSPKADVIKIAPIPGICVKSKKSDGEKVFINICKHTEIPPPVIPMTEEKLKTIIEKQVTTSLFSVPMHFGTVRIEQDKSGGKCVACDVIINYKWSDEVMSKSTTFTTFVVHVAMEGLVDQEGNKITLDRENWTILKNKKYLGNIQQQDVCLERFKPMESIKDTERQINEVAKKVAEMKKMKNEDDQTCLFCKIPYVSKKEYVEHVNELHRDEVQSCIDNDKDVPWCVCEYCRIYLPSKETLNKHTYAVHGVKRAESEEIERLLDAEDEVANIVTSKYFKPDIEKTPSSNEIPTKEEEAPKELTPAKPKNIAQESDTSKQNDSNETNNKEWQLKIDFIIKSYFMNKENKTNNQKDKENVNVDEDAPSKETTLSTSDFMKLEILFALCGKSIMQAFRGSTKQPLPNNCPLCLDLKTNFTTQSPMSYLYHVHQKHLDHIKKNKNWRECGACQTYLPSMEVSRHHFKLAHKQQDVYFKPQATDSNNGQNNNFISSRTDDQRLLEIINKSYNNESKRLTKIFGPLDDKSNSSKKGSNSQKKDIKGEQNDGKGPTETGSEDKSKNMQNDTELGEHLENLDREYSGDTDRREKIKKRLIKVYKLVRALADEQITISETQLNTLRNIDETDDDIADYLMSHFQKKIEEKQKERDPLGLALDKASHESGMFFKGALSNFSTPSGKSRGAENRNMSQKTPNNHQNKSKEAAEREAYLKLKQSTTPLSAAAKLRAKLLGEKMGEVIHFAPSTDNNITTIGDVTITKLNATSSNSPSNSRGFQNRSRGRPAKSGQSSPFPSPQSSLHSNNKSHTDPSDKFQPSLLEREVMSVTENDKSYDMMNIPDSIEKELEREIGAVKTPSEKLKQLQDAIKEQEKMNSMITGISATKDEEWVDVSSGDEDDGIEVIKSVNKAKNRNKTNKEKDAFTKLKDDFEAKYNSPKSSKKSLFNTPKSKSITKEDADRVFKSLDDFENSAKELTEFFKDDEVEERKKLLASLHQEINFTNIVASSAILSKRRK